MSVSYVTAPCVGCGAPLPIAADAQIVVCRYCGGRHGLDRSRQLVPAERMAALEEQLTDRAYADFLAELDADWEVERERYGSKDKQTGAVRYPAKEMAQVIWAVAAGVVLVALLITLSGGPRGLPVLAALCVAGAVPMGLEEWRRAKAYDAARAAYLVTRSAVRRDDFRPGPDGRIRPPRRPRLTSPAGSTSRSAAPGSPGSRRPVARPVPPGRSG